MIRFGALKLRSILLVGVVSGVVILTAYLSLGFGGNSSAVQSDSSYMPQMTMVYEVYGDSISVGAQNTSQYKVVRRLEYVSKTNWVDTIIESPSLDLGRYGTHSAVGSYITLDGNTITEYDAIDGSTETETIATDTVFLPDGALSYSLLTRDSLDNDPGITRTRTTSEVTACIDDECQSNAPSLHYTGNGVNVVILDVEAESWVVPIKLGDGFVVKSVNIQTSPSD